MRTYREKIIRYDDDNKIRESQENDDITRLLFRSAQYITKQVTYERKSVNIDDPKVMEMDECVFIPMETEETNDWDKVDEIIIKLQLTPEEIQLLDYRMSGKSYPEIGRLVGCANSTARARLLRIGKRYLNIQ